MKRLLFTLAALAGMALAFTAKKVASAKCSHRHVGPYLGGHQCLDCPAVFADLEEAGLLDGAYITVRTQFGRGAGEGITKQWGVQ